ncbi:hypothetical protein CEQ90_04895 [Lewinellaceae bacterium SD302]|nr:hypothetical protein CEQ90_04895 [Lewinellaceae bacterium SD302]
MHRATTSVLYPWIVYLCANIHFMFKFSYSLVFILTAFLLSGCNGNNAPASGSSDNTAQSSVAQGLNIVHVKSDSLRTGYLALAREFDRLEENLAKAQENLTADGNALQREVATLQNKAQQGLLSPNQIQAEQQRVARKEQEILQRREIALGSIQKEELELQTKFSEKVQEILQALKEEKGYDYILNQGPGTGVLISDDSHDITQLVLDRLNAAPDPVMDEASSDDEEPEE